MKLTSILLAVLVAAAAADTPPAGESVAGLRLKNGTLLTKVVATAIRDTGVDLTHASGSVSVAWADLPDSFAARHRAILAKHKQAEAAAAAEAEAEKKNAEAFDRAARTLPVDLRPLLTIRRTSPAKVFGMKPDRVSPLREDPDIKWNEFERGPLSWTIKTAGGEAIHVTGMTNNGAMPLDAILKSVGITSDKGWIIIRQAKTPVMDEVKLRHGRWSVVAKAIRESQDSDLITLLNIPLPGYLDNE